MSGRALTPAEIEFLNSPTCTLWPECSCHDNLLKWQAALLDEDRTFNSEQLEWAEEVLFYTMACVSRHCPEPKIKKFGERQFARLTARRERIALKVEPRRQCL